MDSVTRQHIATLKALTQDSFISTLEAGLDRLSEKSTSVERPSWYTVDSPKDTEEAALQAMCSILAMLGQSTTASEKNLTTLLPSSGLQEDRTQLLLAQSDQLVKLGSLRKQNGIPLNLLDIQWKLGVVAGSSEEGEAGRTFVQVSFISQTPGTTKKDAKLVEMSLEKFYDFLHQLEKCKASLEHSHFL